MIVFGRIQKGIVLNMKTVDYCESNTQMGQVCVLLISMKFCKTSMMN